MKRILFSFFLVLVSANSLLGQNLSDELKKQILINDSLQKQVIKPLNDSVLNLNSQLRSLTLERNELTSKVKINEAKILGLNKDKIVLERNNLLSLVDSMKLKIKDLERLISNKEEFLQQEKNKGIQNSVRERENGKNEILNRILETYNKSFDELVKISSLYIVERDFSIVGEFSRFEQTFRGLQKYLNALQLLSEKYNEQKILAAVTQLKSIEQTELVLNLIERLNDYKLCNDGLRKVFDKIAVIDKKFVANDDYTKIEKFKDILAEISWYIRNYRFNFTDYPHISNILLDIIKSKQLDPNSSISLIYSRM